MKINKYQIYLTIIFFIFLFVNFIILSFSQGINSFLMGADSYSYIDPAKNLVEKGSLAYTNGEFMHNNTPLYPFFLSLFLYFENNYFFNYVILTQVILLFLSSYIATIIFNFENYKIKLIFLSLLLFNPNLLITAHLCQTEILYLFFFISSLYFLIKYKNNFKYKNLFFCSLFIALSTLTRPIGLYIFYSYVILIIFFL